MSSGSKVVWWKRERSSGAKEEIENSFHLAYSDLWIDRVWEGKWSIEYGIDWL